MATRKGWDAISPGYRSRLEKAGITEQAYNSGASIKKGRGHSNTPEHGFKEAVRHPEKYPEYLRKHTRGGGGETPERIAKRINEILDAAYKNIHERLGNYHKYRDRNVRANVYGGVRGPQFLGEGSEVEMPMMDTEDALWTANADTEELRSRASNQTEGNPWFYH